jgi:hypothetical protein
MPQVPPFRIRRRISFHYKKEVEHLLTQSEIIKELAEKLERQLIIDDLSKIQSIEELKKYVEKLRAKNET